LNRQRKINEFLDTGYICIEEEENYDLCLLCCGGKIVKVVGWVWWWVQGVYRTGFGHKGGYISHSYLERGNEVVS